MILVVAYPEVLKPFMLGSSCLVRTWRTRNFWLQRFWLLHWTSLVALIFFWTSSIAVVAIGGPAPLLAWMFSAFGSVIQSTRVNWRIYFGSISHENPQGNLATAMLLLQFSMIIVANAAMIIVMLAKGWGFRTDDLWIAGVAILGSGVVWLCTRKESPWRLAGYAISQKSGPQVVQAWSIFTTVATLPLLAIVSLFVQGSSRLTLSITAWWPARRDRTDQKKLAQFANAGVDWLTVGGIVAGVTRDTVE